MNLLSKPFIKAIIVIPCLLFIGCTAQMDTVDQVSTDRSNPNQIADSIVDGYGAVMRLIPAGDFIMGSESGAEDEKPQMTIYVDDFYMDQYEVTNDFYADCVEDQVCDPPLSDFTFNRTFYYGNDEYSNYPVVSIEWSNAKTFCEWRGARLPTEAEWEKAARGTDGRLYAWGNDINCGMANIMYLGESCITDTTTVGSYDMDKSIYGIYDMTGNVGEWISSLYMPYPYDPDDGREDPNEEGRRVKRGCPDGDLTNLPRLSYRCDTGEYLFPWDIIGFRCAKSP